MIIRFKGTWAAGGEGGASGASYSRACGWTRGRSPAWLLSLDRARPRFCSARQAPLVALVVSPGLPGVPPRERSHREAMGEQLRPRSLCAQHEETRGGRLFLKAASRPWIDRSKKGGSVPDSR